MTLKELSHKYRIEVWVATLSALAWIILYAAFEGARHWIQWFIVWAIANDAVHTLLRGLVEIRRYARHSNGDARASHGNQWYAESPSSGMIRDL